MDKKSIIGLALIAILLLVYFNYVSPPLPEPNTGEQGQAPTTFDGDRNDNTDSTNIKKALPKTKVKSDSLPTVQEGLFALQQGTEKNIHIENKDMAIDLSSRGGILKRVRLKQFTAYGDRPLYLMKDESSIFSLLARYRQRDIDLYALHYNTYTYQRGDSALVVFKASSEDGSSIEQIYTLPPSGHELGYSIEVNGSDIDASLLTLVWHNKIILQERHMPGSRNKTTINYYTLTKDFEGLSEMKSELESTNEDSPLKWVAMKQKFFISAIIAKQSFRSGEIASIVNPSQGTDTSTVKDLQAKLFIAKQGLAEQKNEFTYFFGPMKYELLAKTTEGFSKNLNLGWPPIVWVNRFVIIPIFKFLENYISSYGIIIIILVLIIKLALSPLSYKSYLGMAKMRLLKPELDLLREKHKGDMSKIQQEQLKLYQQAGVNPFSGCIPLLLQMPILFAMFYFFPVSIELRQSGFLWAEDLSTYDSILNLPFTIPFYGNHVSLFVLLMTASTIIYTWQNNQISSAQGPMKSISYLMPIIFMFVLNSFSAGLSFYYFVANLVTFSQQAIIRKFVDEGKIKTVMEKHRKKILSGGKKRSRLMSKLQEAMKANQEQQKQKNRTKP